MHEGSVPSVAKGFIGMNVYLTEIKDSRAHNFCRENNVHFGINMDSNLQLCCFTILEKLLNFKSQFPHPENGNDDKSYLTS